MTQENELERGSGKKGHQMRQLKYPIGKGYKALNEDSGSPSYGKERY